MNDKEKTPCTLAVYFLTAICFFYMYDDSWLRIVRADTKNPHYYQAVFL